MVSERAASPSQTFKMTPVSNASIRRYRYAGSEIGDCASNLSPFAEFQEEVEEEDESGRKALMDFILSPRERFNTHGLELKPLPMIGSANNPSLFLRQKTDKQKTHTSKFAKQPKRPTRNNQTEVNVVKKTYKA